MDTLLRERNGGVWIIGKEIIKLGDYLFSDEIFSLQRKYKKYLEIKNSYGNNKGI